MNSLALGVALAYLLGMLKVGAEAPDFEAQTTLGRRIRLRDLRGTWVILYFFPKAFTKG